VRHRHVRALRELGDTERAADRQGDQHADVTLPEQAGFAQRCRDLLAAPAIGQHELR
jgi:hypothetical protein